MTNLSLPAESWELANRLRDHPVFICGHPKAGTSLLRAVLDSHPQLVVYPEETGFFRRTLPRMAGLSLEDQIRLAEQTLIHIFRWNLADPDPSQEGFPDRDYSSIPLIEVRNALEQFLRSFHRQPGDLLSAAVLAFGVVSGTVNPEVRYWVEKSPYNEYYAEKIYSWWPEARCIHILRDPRDNFASYRRKHPDWNAEFFSANWSRSTRAGLQNREIYGSQRYFFVRYEDLAQSPEQYLAQMADFLKISWDRSLIQPTRFGQHWAGNSMFDDQFQDISATPLSRSKENLTPDEIEVITSMTRPFLKSWGYQDQASSHFSTRVVGLFRSLSWPVRRFFYHRQKSTAIISEPE
jgi:hypothetical protein